MKLASGLDLHRPAETMEAFVRNEYEAYDGISVCPDDILRPEEIAISVMVNSQISGNTARRIWEQRAAVESHLSGIRPDISILDDDNVIPWVHVAGAIEAICGVGRAKLAVATKILHKKRPALIPMMDSVIIDYYHIPGQRDRTWGQYGVENMRVFRKDLLSVRSEIEKLAESYAAKGKPLTPCRVLEMLIWATCEPKEYYRKD